MRMSLRLLWFTAVCCCVYGRVAGIIGGSVSSINKHPYMVCLKHEIDEKYCDCGGSIISDKHILTAAHCLEAFSRLFVAAGSTRSDLRATNLIPVRRKQYLIHPEFKKSTGEFDVGIICLRAKLSLNGKTMKAVKLASSASVVDGRNKIILSGWGESESGHDVTLRALTYNIARKGVSKISYPGFCDVILCAGGKPEGGRGFCYGDSGGPAVVRDKNNHQKQIGVVSFTDRGCGEPNVLDVYVDVAKIRAWIRKEARV